MVKKARNIIRAGVGLATISREDIDKIFEELAARGEVEEKSREEFVRKALKRLGKKGKNATNKMKKVAKRVLKTSHDKIEAMNKRIEELMKELEVAKKKQQG